jgi:aerobic carbon-monoxide dehydrogenase medium subunit
VIPAEFDYVAPDSLDEALAALADGGEDAKVLAGGHSLLPLMKMRLAVPTLLVDLRRLDDLRGVERANGSWRLGALTRHVELQDNDEMGLASTAAKQIADQQVRNRGTIGGTLAHGDPASDLPAVLLASEGSVTARAASGGERTIAAADLFEDYLTTALAPDEIIVSVDLPAHDGWGHGYEKFTRRAEDWAMVGVCALVKKAQDGSCEDVRVALTHMSATPLRAGGVEEALRGGALDEETIGTAAEQAAEGTDPPADLNASEDYKKHLARVLTKRALLAAAK